MAVCGIPTLSYSKVKSIREDADVESTFSNRNGLENNRVSNSNAAERRDEGGFHGLGGHKLTLSRSRWGINTQRKIRWAGKPNKNE